jgi:hypothetical protein
MSVFLGTHKSPADSVAKAAGMVMESAKEGVKMAAHAVKDAAFAAHHTFTTGEAHHAASVHMDHHNAAAHHDTHGHR